MIIRYDIFNNKKKSGANSVSALYLNNPPCEPGSDDVKHTVASMQCKFVDFPFAMFFIKTKQ